MTKAAKHVHEYKGLTDEQYEELFSNYLINSWSYSKVNSFARNEKAFEMQYIYNYDIKLSASNIAGQAYHKALELFFARLSEKKSVDVIDLQAEAYAEIERVEPNRWKTQKTTPTIDKCIEKATKTVNALIDNFMQENSVYETEEAMEVEVYAKGFVTINGVDIPLPVAAKIDLIQKTKDGKQVIVDHKSRNKFTDEKDAILTMGKQAITYYNIVTQELGYAIDEVWFIENKYSKNRDGSPQLNCIKVPVDKDTERLYNALLYEPLRRMIEAVSNPDYIYLINESDNLTDKAELYEFWSKTMIAEVDDFQIDEDKKVLIGNRLKKIRDASLATVDPKIIKNFNENAASFIQFDFNKKNMTKQEKIEHVLLSLGLRAKVIHTFSGYSNDTYLLSLSAGTNISSIFKYKLDIASVLNVPNIRINKELYVYEGSSYVAIESSKKMDGILPFDEKYLEDMKIPLGLNNLNQAIIWDLDNHSTPHALICGATGSGKSVEIINIIEYAKLAGVTEIVIFDPKYEFSKYRKDCRVYSEIEAIEEKMEELVEEMNDRIRDGRTYKTLVIFDEFADAVSQSRKGKDLKVYEDVLVGHDKYGDPKYKSQHTRTMKTLEENLKVLLQKGRSSGFRIIAATQRASTKVITGDAKVNFPVQICFRVPKEIDSQVVLGETGAEALAGKGDGLVNSPEYFGVQRFQAFYKG